VTSYTTFAFQVTVLPVSIMAWIRNRREIKVGPMIKIGYARASSIDQNLDRRNQADIAGWFDYAAGSAAGKHHKAPEGEHNKSPCARARARGG
jgi:hypothetical protein